MEINLKIERLEGGRGFLRDKKGRLIVWPGDFLPPEAKEGEEISFRSGKESKNENTDISAKDILNEIFLS